MGEQQIFNSVRQLNREPQPPRICEPIVLKSGAVLSDITPYNILLKTVKDNKPHLVMYYMNRQKKVCSVPVSEINGLDEIVEGDNHFILFIYFNPKSGQPERRQRKIQYKQINYGVHQNHKAFGETDDFYLIAEDMQYLEGQRERNFPFWRMGIYGDSSKVQSKFMAASNSV
jgi:hypothetical protein